MRRCAFFGGAWSAEAASNWGRQRQRQQLGQLFGDAHPCSTTLSLFLLFLLPLPPQTAYSSNKQTNSGTDQTAKYVERGGQWHHLAVTWSVDDDGLTKIYWDGLLMAEAVTKKTQPLEPGGAFMLGAEQVGNCGCVVCCCVGLVLWGFYVWEGGALLALACVESMPLVCIFPLASDSHDATPTHNIKHTPSTASTLPPSLHYPPTHTTNPTGLLWWLHRPLPRLLWQHG